MSESEDACYISETVARGPIVFRKADLEKLDYLDESHFFLGNDDHDLCRRLFESGKRLVGYVPIRIYSIRDDGSTRQPRTGINEQVYEYLKTQKTGSLEFKAFLKNYKPYKAIKRIPFNPMLSK
jgi:GT2 family glycosyltransferase